MEQETPTWLNEQFLVSALQGGEDEEPRVTLVKFSVVLAIPPGNNYLSHVYRVTVDYTINDSSLQKISLIVKAPVTRGLVVDMSDKLDLLSMEPRIYKELMPRIHTKVTNRFAPKSFYCPKELVNGLVLQDLKEEGYVLCDRLKQLDYSHCKIAIIALAKFHATSVACYHEDPEFIKAVGEERLYKEDGPFQEDFKPWMQGAVTIITSLVSNLDDCKDSVDYFMSKSDKLGESATQICKPRENGLNVLNHGDFWMSNMLFKHDDSGKALDVKFVDFQITRFASPVLDLIYFFWTSANVDVRNHKQNELFATYLDTLNTTLEDLGCQERYTEEEFRNDINTSTDWAVIAICNVLPVVVCEPENVMNMEEMKEDDFKSNEPSEMFKKVYEGKHFKALLPNVMAQFSSWIPS